MKYIFKRTNRLLIISLLLCTLLLAGCTNNGTVVATDEIGNNDTTIVEPADTESITDTEVIDVTADVPVDNVVQKTEPTIAEEYEDALLVITEYSSGLKTEPNLGATTEKMSIRGDVLYIIALMDNGWYKTNENLYISSDKVISREAYEEKYGKVYVFIIYEEAKTMYVQKNASSYNSTKEDADEVAQLKKCDEVTVIAYSDDGIYYKLEDLSIVDSAALGDTMPTVAAAPPASSSGGGSSSGTVVADAPGVTSGTPTLPSSGSTAPAIPEDGTGYDFVINPDGTVSIVYTNPTTPSTPATPTEDVWTYDCYLVTGMTGEINTRRSSNGLAGVTWDSSLESEALLRARELAPNKGQGAWDNFNHSSPGGHTPVSECIAQGFWGNNAKAIDEQYASSTSHDGSLHKDNTLIKVCSANCDVYINGVLYASYNVTFKVVQF